MDDDARALRRVVARVEPDGRTPGGRVLTHHEVGDPEHLEDLGLEPLVHAAVGAELARELVEPTAERNGFAAGDELERRAAGHQHEGGHGDPHPRAHAWLRRDPRFTRTSERRFSTKPSRQRRTKAAPKTSKPENEWKKPCAISSPKKWASRPVPATRVALAAIAMGTAETTSSARRQTPACVK